MRRTGPDVTVDPMLPSCIMFTSGTTSKPKGVVHTHANAIWASRTGARNIDLGAEDRYLVYTPFFHVNAQTWSSAAGLRHRGHGRARAEVVVQPLLGDGRPARDHPLLPHALLHVRP